jgi:hypothetical protein
MLCRRHYNDFFLHPTQHDFADYGLRVTDYAVRRTISITPGKRSAARGRVYVSLYQPRSGLNYYVVQIGRPVHPPGCTPLGVIEIKRHTALACNAQNHTASDIINVFAMSTIVEIRLSRSCGETQY